MMGNLPGVSSPLNALYFLTFVFFCILPLQSTKERKQDFTNFVQKTSFM